jgi:hypothetical protein
MPTRMQRGRIVVSVESWRLYKEANPNGSSKTWLFAVHIFLCIASFVSFILYTRDNFAIYALQDAELPPVQTKPLSP